MRELTVLTMRLGEVSSRRGIRRIALDVIDAFDTIFKKLVKIKYIHRFFKNPCHPCHPFAWVLREMI